MSTHDATADILTADVNACPVGTGADADQMGMLETSPLGSVMSSSKPGSKIKSTAMESRQKRGGAAPLREVDHMDHGNSSIEGVIEDAMFKSDGTKYTGEMKRRTR